MKLFTMSFREFLYESDEDKKKRKTKTDTKKPDLNFGPRMDKLPSTPNGGAASEKSDSKKDAKLRTASREKTERDTSGISLPDDAHSHIKSLLKNMPVKDEPPAREVSTRVKSANVPAVISQAMVAAGKKDPQFHIVANLPGNMAAGIRQLGKQLFSVFTSTPTDEISMIGNVMGMGPNSPSEINAVANFVKSHGRDLGDGDIDFNDIMPGYSADIMQYSAVGIRFMLVKDLYGQYIYAWPENTSKTPGPQKPKLK